MTFLNLPYYDNLINLNFYQDALESRRAQLTQCNETIDENSMFLDIVGGKQRNAVYGLGSQASEYYGISGASTSTTSPFPQQNEEEMQELRERLTHQEEVINKLESLTSHLLQRMDEMSRAQQPPLVPTRLISDPVHDDDTDDDDDDDNNTIPK